MLDCCEKTVSPQLVCDSVLVEWITCVNGSLCLFSRVLRKRAEEREHFVLRHRREKKFTTNTGEVTAWKRGASARKEKHSQRIFVLVVILFTLNKCTVLCTGSPAFGSCFHNHDTGFQANRLTLLLQKCYFMIFYMSKIQKITNNSNIQNRKLRESRAREIAMWMVRQEETQTKHTQDNTGNSNVS